MLHIVKYLFLPYVLLSVYSIYDLYNEDIIIEG